MRVRGPAVAVVVSAALGGCGGGGSHAHAVTATKRSAAALDGCVRPGRGVRLVSFQAPGERVPAAIVGDGPIGVVFANQSGNDMCGWLPFARRLAGQGFRSLLFDYAAASNVDETIAALRAVRSDGARSTALVGASLGGMVAVRVAARRHVGLSSVVTLSAERSGRSMGDTVAFARRVHVPSLYVGTKNDGWTTFGADTRALHRATPARIDRMVLLSGSEHGVDILAGPHGSAVQRAVMRFLRITPARHPRRP
jgi:hypothetical protein